MARLRNLAAVAAACMAASACGGGGGDAQAVTTTTTKATTTTARQTTTTTRPTTTTEPVPFEVEPGDPVIVDCDTSRIEVSIARPAAQERLRVIYSYDPTSALARLGLQLGPLGCSGRETFNDDFSLIVTDASVEDTGMSHVVVIDLAARKVIDLTEPRQGTGFASGEPLEESAISFLPSQPDRVRYTDQVVLWSGSDQVVVDPANPSKEVARWTYDEAGNKYGPWLDGVLDYVGSGNDYNDFFHGRTILSPDGRFLLSDSGGSYVTRVFAEDGRHDFPYECSGFPEGWRDARTAVVAGDNNFYLVPIDDNGDAGACVPIFPPSEREFIDGRLRLDGQALLVTVKGVDSDEHYIADLTKPGSEPAVGSSQLVMEPQWRVYFPRSD